MTVNDIITLAVIFGANILSFVILWSILHTHGRKKPLGVVSETYRIIYLAYLKRNKNIHLLEDLEGRCIFYTDWDRGIGYGYMESPLKLGDQILVNADKKNKYHILIVYRTYFPSEQFPNFFHFRTFYLGSKYVTKVKRVTAEEKAKLQGFQSYS